MKLTASVCFSCSDSLKPLHFLSTSSTQPMRSLSGKEEVRLTSIRTSSSLKSNYDKSRACAARTHADVNTLAFPKMTGNQQRRTGDFATVYLSVRDLCECTRT